MGFNGLLLSQFMETDLLCDVPEHIHEEEALIKEQMLCFKYNVKEENGFAGFVGGNEEEEKYWEEVFRLTIQEVQFHETC